MEEGYFKKKKKRGKESFARECVKNEFRENWKIHLTVSMIVVIITLLKFSQVFKLLDPKLTRLVEIRP